MASTGWIRRRGWGIAVGAAVTLLTVLADLAGWLAPLEYFFLDYSFRHFNRIEADPRIVLIDIDDRALERIHRWPWPRRLQADLVSVLHECGAEAILLDLVYAERTPARIVHPLLEPDAEVNPTREVLGDLSLRDAVHDDKELAGAIARAGNVYVAMFFATQAPSLDMHAVRLAARDLLDENPSIDMNTFAAGIGKHDARRTAEIFSHARIDHLLRGDLSLTAEALAEALDLTVDEVTRHLPYLKTLAARHLAERFLEAHAEASFAEACAHVLPGAPADVESPDRREVLQAFWHARSSRVVFSRALNVGGRFEGVIPNGSNATLPIESIAAAARKVGFVNFGKDADGVLRHVPILARLDGRVVLQVAFALASDVLDIEPNDIEVEPGHILRLRDRRGASSWRVPLNERGEMLLNWHVDRTDPRWVGSFEHIPAAYVMEVAINRQTIEDNHTRHALHVAEAVELMYGEAASAYLDYERNIRRRNELRARSASLTAPGAKEFAQLEAALQKTESSAVANVAHLISEIEGLEPQDDVEKELFGRVRRLHRLLVAGAFTELVARHNDALRRRNEDLLNDLRRRIGGKLCFVGHTAAAQADMVNTPVFENMPGVMAHANLVNTFLRRRIPTVALRGVNVALIVATGMLITVLTSAKGPWVTLLSVLLLMAASLASAAVLMWRFGLYVAASVPAVSIFVTWALITLYRQLTEQRQRRSFARELARNTSPAIAARITERLDDLDLAPRPTEVTCYFSDLQGFTAISERLGVAQTQTILNRYLGAMGEVLIEYKAFNKFMGDGIFAFFNAPIWPEEHHAATGCEAALVTLEKLAWLKSTAHESIAEHFQSLRMRIGLHTGPVFVGYFGSENQTDYTCIGDTVNLAARLESANKAFGTQALVSGACRDAVADAYAFRRLGALQVKGKARAVAVYELLGRADEVREEMLAYAGEFSAAVSQFQARRWDAAREAFEHCRSLRPDDEAVRVYLTAIDACATSPPPADWNQAIELTTK